MDKQHADDLSAAYNSGRNDALTEAAKVVLAIDAEKFRATYRAEYNRKRYDIAGLERNGNRCMNIQAEDARDAVLALMVPTLKEPKT